MGLIHIELFASLDLVGQSPGGPDEDSAGFPFGGWQAPLMDEVAGAQVVAAYEGTDALLLGRRTYDTFAAYWPYQDGEGNPFVITADAAIQDAKNPKRARLTKVEADLSLAKGSWMNANAARGLIDMQAGSLQLDGGINVFSDQGYELHTASAQVDINKGLVHGPAEVTGHGPNGALRADQFQIDRNNKLLTLVGHVQMTIVGKKA